MPDQFDEHLDDADLAHLEAWGLPEASSRRVVGHLLGGCEACRDRVRQHLRLPREQGSTASEYDGVFESALLKCAERIPVELADLAEGALLWPKLRDNPVGRRMMLARNLPKYRTAGVLEALFRDYREGLWREPDEGLEIAELGLAIAEKLDASRYRVTRLADLQGEALAIGANASRRASRPREAAQRLKQAAQRIEEGTGNPLLEAQLLTYQGNHWQTCRRFEAAAGAFGRAEQVYQCIGEPHLAARSLVARAEAIGYHDPQRGIRLLRRAIPAIDAERDPHLELVAHHNLAWYLNDAGQGREARAEVESNAELYHRASGNAMASLSRAWLLGRIDRTLEDLDRARRFYERAWAGFEELGMEVHLTMLSIDRAELRVCQREFASAAALLEGTLALVQRAGAAGETLAVLRMLHEAVAARECRRTAFRQASLVVRRSWASVGSEGEAS